MELRFEKLEKFYGRTHALKGLDATLTPGIYGLLGPNGAGKSTAMNILTGNLKQTSGQVLLDGRDIRTLGGDFYARLGYCPQQQTFFQDFTGEQFLYYMASLHGMTKAGACERIPWALEALGLLSVSCKPIRSYSGGMKQRLLIAQALLHDPDILVLDEPTAGLDPRQRIAVRNLISEIAREKIVLISTHVVQDVEYIAKELILLQNGLVLRQSAPAGLLRELEGKVWEMRLTEADARKASHMGTVSAMAREGELVCLRLVAEKMPELSCSPAKPDLEDVYLYHFGQQEGL